MGSPQSNKATFTITQPGKYYVRVENACGSKTDSIEIFNQCDYTIYMPNTFTPNNDGINDFFRIPPSNKNKLLTFRIYDRWGNLIFQTSKASVGWDGIYKNQATSPRVYIYYVDMLGLSKTKLSQKGFITLIR